MNTNENMKTTTKQHKHKSKLNKLQIENLKKLLKNSGIEPDQVDLQAIIDKTLTYSEVKKDIENLIQRELKTKAETTLTTADIQAMEEEAQKKQYEYLTEQIKAKEESAIQQIKQRTSVDVDKYFTKVQDYIRAVSQKRINSLVLVGEGGSGKSFSVLKTFAEQGLKLGEDYVYLSTYTTPLALYNYMYANREKIILFDDVEGIIDSDEQVSILKSALWSSTGYRTVCWNTTSDKRSAPEKFEFNGSVVICLNELPKSKSAKALLSRGIVQEMAFNHYDKLKIMAEISKLPYKDTTPEERTKVFDYIKEHASIASKNLNFRTLIISFDLYKSNPEKWQELVAGIIEEDEDLKILSKILSNGMTVKEQIKEFGEKTGYARASFFRFRKKLEERLEKIKNVV